MSGKLPGTMPLRRVIGFTGHRKLREPEKIAALIAEQINAISGGAPGDLAAISSIACGADTLFAQEVIRAGIPWIALLPFPRVEFRKDFSKAEWLRAEACLKQAAAEEVWSAQGARPDVYREVGIHTINHSNIVLAVWNGSPARGRGGTGEIIAYARGLKRPLVWIHTQTFAVTRENWPDRSLTGPLG